MNRYPNFGNVLKTVALTGALGAFAIGCANPSGEGNEFVVTGEVTHVGTQSIGADIFEIDETNGDANGWFEDGTYHVIHDNCDCHGFWSGRKQYGHVENFDGETIDISEVVVGECIEFTGKIRSDNDGKYTSERPVYEVAQVVPCG